MAKKSKRDEAQRDESIAELVERVGAHELRTFVIRLAGSNKEFERELREEFGLTDAGQAAAEIEYVTDSLLDEYGWDGSVEWQNLSRFEREYGDAVRAIVRPFLLRRDAESLAYLAITRLVQLQEICIDNSDDLYTDAFDEIGKQLDRAFKLADEELRSRMFVMLADFLKENPGKDHASIYDDERDFVREFLEASFAKDTAFTSRVIEFADQQIDGLLDTASDEHNSIMYERGRWARLRLVAMVTRGDAPGEVRTYAEKFELLDVADVVRTVADAYVLAKAPREAAAVLRENLEAIEQYHEYGSAQPIRVLDRLEKLARRCYSKAELAELYRELLVRDWENSLYRSHISTTDRNRWYDGLRSATDEAAWADVRMQLLEAVPYSTANTLLAHDESWEELYQHLMANGGKEILTYERVLSDAHPEVYVDYYLRDAKLCMSMARSRTAYREVANQLAKAAKLAGGRDGAEALARRFATKFAKRPALLDELRKAGFEV